ncbi:MAG: NAD(P)-dependent oxidoreductase [Deltaproteobacteria bacterium]|nr:NAD(P)-dependent oxidoreductase [Deltaproteobacteria bacterium]
MTKESVALLGTGIMGAAMGRNLLKAGHPLRVWNRTPEKAASLAADGAVVSASIEEALEGATVVLTLLADGPATREVMNAERVAGLAPGVLWIQSATVGVPEVTELSLLAREHGVAFVDAPVLGTRAPAEAGTLTLLASGEASTRERAAPIFEAVGSRTLWVGEAGAGTRLKLVVNNWIVGLTGVLGESLALAGELELDPALFFEAIEGGALDLPYARMKGEAMLARDYPTSFPLRLARKDARLIDGAARHATLPLLITRAVEHYLSIAQQEGHGDADFSAVFEAIRAARS